MQRLNPAQKIDPRNRRGPREVSAEKGSASATDRPREKILRLGVERLADREVLALVLGTGTAGRPVLELAGALLTDCGGLEVLATLSAAQLQAFPGIGPAKSASLAAAMEIGRRTAARPLRNGDPIKSPGDVYRHFLRQMRGRKQEFFMVLLLDGRNRVMWESQISQGTLTASLVHPREVFRPAIGAAAAALVLAHNHPSGDPTPSSEDLRVTRRLTEVGELVGIRVVDHVIVAEEGFYSFQENGQMDQ